MAIIRNSLIYLSSSVISKASPYLLLPFLTSYLEPAEFGVLAIFLAMNSLYNAFNGMALDVNVAKNFFKKSKPELALIIGNIFFILLTTSSLYFAVSLIIVTLYDSFFSIPTHYLLILPILSFFAMMNKIHLAVLRSEGRAYTFGVFEIANAFFSLAITLIFLIYLEMGWLSQVIGMATASLVLSLIGVGYLYRRGYVNLNFRKAETISILK